MLKNKIKKVVNNNCGISLFSSLRAGASVRKGDYVFNNGLSEGIVTKITQSSDGLWKVLTLE